MVTILSQDSIDQFLSSITVNGGSPNTVKAYGSDLRGLLAVTGEMPLGRLEEPAARWLTDNRSTWSPKTTSRKATSIKAWARWAGKTDFLSKYRLPDAGRAEPHPIPEGMDGVDRLFEACDVAPTNIGRSISSAPQRRALVSLTCQIGLRVSEALSVTPASFDHIERTVTVRGKGDKRRVLPVPAVAWPNLVEAIAGAALVAPTAPLLPWSDRQARRVFTELGAKAGLSRAISSHDGRATFGTHVYRMTNDLRVVQELMGHSSARTTEVYTEVNMNGMRKAVEASF